MKQQFINHLYNDIAPFWENLLDERGGYYSLVNSSGIVKKNAQKGVILNSRILYFFSNLYSLSHDFHFKLYADHAYDFLKNCCFDHEYGGVYWMMNANGSVLEDVKHSYNQAFAIYALSSYSIAFKNDEALNLALQLFELVEKNAYTSNGYIEEFSREWQPTNNEKLADKNPLAKKTMNTLLHLLEAYTELYIASQNNNVLLKLKNLLYIFEHTVYNDNLNRLEVFFNEDMTPSMNAHSFGHDIEASWLIDRACEVIGQKQNPYTLSIAKNVFETAISSKGYIYNEKINEEIDTTVVWWIQAESVIGFYNAYQKSGNEMYLNAVNNVWSFIKNKLILPSGEWIPYLEEKNGNMIKYGNIVDQWKCPYHNGRMCFEMIKRL